TILDGNTLILSGPGEPLGAMYDATNAPRGSPGPESIRVFPSSIVPDITFPANAPISPTTAADTITRCPASSLRATPAPIPAPVSPAATLPSVKIRSPIFSPQYVPICWMIVPMISVAKRPWAIPVRPSINILSRNFFICFHLPLCALHLSETHTTDQYTHE